MDQFQESLWQFSVRLTEVLGRKKGTNFLISPLSAFLALSAVMTGAKGRTENELAALLMGPEFDHTHSEAFFKWIKLISNQIQESEEITMSIANKIAINTRDSKLKLIPSAIKNLKENFLAHLELIDFGDKEAIEISINKWVSKKTNGKISKIVDGKLDAEREKMMILNAIYFKGDWASPFSASSTSERTFYSNGKQMKTKFMYSRKYFNFADVAELDAKMLEMDYEDAEYSMLVILPNKRGSLDAVEKKMQKVKLEELYRKFTRGFLVDLFIPKFKIEADFDISKALKGLGCTTMFSEKDSDFTGFCRKPYILHVSSVQQKTFIEVDEKGTEAAAVTKVQMRGRPSARPNPQKPKVFDANHPFLFFLIHKSDDENSSPSVLFHGRLCVPKRPTKSKKAQTAD